jgi:hypothetical protein
MQKWEYLVLNVVRSYGLTYRRNGEKIGDWKNKQVFEVLAILGDEGYELSAYDGVNYIFKRPKGVPAQRPAGAPVGQPASGQRPPAPPQGQRPPAPPQGQRPPGALPPRPLQKPPSDDDED